MQVLEEAAKALEVARKPPTAFPLRDHRPLVLNQLDYQRVAAMERREGFSMRDARGVVVHPNSKPSPRAPDLHPCCMFTGEGEPPERSGSKAWGGCGHVLCWAWT